MFGLNKEVERPQKLEKPTHEVEVLWADGSEAKYLSYGTPWVDDGFLNIETQDEKYICINPRFVKTYVQERCREAGPATA